MRRVTKTALLATAFLGAAAVSCRAAEKAPSVSAAPSSSAPAPPTASRRGPHLRLADAPAGSVASIVQQALSEETRDKRRLLVYVGAPWCEPCQRFQDAARRGELDSVFGDLTLLEFDQDRDGDRLKAAGYQSQYIPLFALPAPDGSSSGKQIEGSIKGEGAVANLAPRLERLLAR